MSTSENVYSASVSRDGRQSVTGFAGSLVRPLIFAALLGGVLAGFAAHRTYGTIPFTGTKIARPELSEKAKKETEENWATMKFSDDVYAEKVNSVNVGHSRDSAVALGLAGLILGGAFGLAAAWGAGRRVTGVIAGLLQGVIIGSIGGLIAGQCAMAFKILLDEKFRKGPTTPRDLAGRWLTELYTSVAVHATVWCLLGIGLTIVVILARGSMKSAAQKLLAGVIAGIAGAAAYTPVSAIFFSNLNSGMPLPEGFFNAVAFMVIASLMIAIFIGREAAVRADSIK